MFVHGDNLTRKEEANASNDTLRGYLFQIRDKYDKWKKENMQLIGPVATPAEDDSNIIAKRVKLLNDYKDFIDQKVYAEAFDSRSNLHSTVLEEFCYYLFKDLVSSISSEALIGKSHAFKDIFYNSTSYIEMVSRPSFLIEKKDHDFVIGVSIEGRFKCKGGSQEQIENLQIPAVAIECKTYLDKTMLEGASSAASQLLVVNPNSLYIVLSEWLKLTDSINLKKYNVDQIYVLRKQKNTDRKYRLEAGYSKNPIYLDVVENLFDMVRTHLTTDWENSNTQGLERGYLIQK